MANAFAPGETILPLDNEPPPLASPPGQTDSVGAGQDKVSSGLANIAEQRTTDMLVFAELDQFLTWAKKRGPLVSINRAKAEWVNGDKAIRWTAGMKNSCPGIYDEVILLPGFQSLLTANEEYS
jgi:hypothetical protein